MIDFSELGADAIYVVNLESATVRKRDIKKHLDSNFDNIEYDGENANVHFIEAVDGSKIKPEHQFPKMIKEGILNDSFVDPGGLLTANIIACSLSHKKALETFFFFFFNTALILEDDVRLSDDFYREYAKGTFQKFVKEAFAVPNWQVIYYSKQWEWIPSEGKYSDNAYQPVKHLPCYANAAYVVNRESAKMLLKKWLPIEMAADTYVESHHTITVAYEYSWFNQYRAELKPTLAHLIHGAIHNVVPPHHGSLESPEESRTAYGTMTSMEVHNNDANTGQYDNTHEAAHAREPYIKHVKHVNIPDNIPVEKVTWEDVEFPDGNIGYNWCRIWLQQ